MANFLRNTVSTVMQWQVGILVYPTIAVLVIGIINAVLTDEMITRINQGLTYVDYFLGSRRTNILLCLIVVIGITKIIRRITKFISTGGQTED